jgi:VWFA-related protein
MIIGNRLTSYCSRITSLALLFAVCISTMAQEKERPKLKDFGSSLKRIKWDEATKSAVDVKSKSTATAASEDIDVVKVETSLVSNDVLVLDARGNFVSGLTEKDFSVAEDGTPQQVGMFSLGENAKVPRSIVLIIDYSGSQFPFISTSVTAAKMLVDKLAPLDSMAIVTDDVELIQDFTKDKNKLKSKLDSLLKKVIPNEDMNNFENLRAKHFGRSKQYSALLATLREAFNSEDQRPVVIFQTDGDQIGSLRNSPIPYRGLAAGLVDKRSAAVARKFDEENRTQFSLDDIYRAAEKARATIYTVVSEHQMLGRPFDEVLAEVKSRAERTLQSFPIPSSMMREQRERLEKLRAFLLSDEQLKISAEDGIKMQSALASVATSTGGWTMFLEKPDDADHIYSSIFSDINRRYIVGYYPTNKEHDGKRRKIDLTVRDHPEYTIVGRRWYYAADQ